MYLPTDTIGLVACESVSAASKCDLGLRFSNSEIGYSSSRRVSKCGAHGVLQHCFRSYSLLSLAGIAQQGLPEAPQPQPAPQQSLPDAPSPNPPLTGAPVSPSEQTQAPTGEASSADTARSCRRGCHTATRVHGSGGPGGAVQPGGQHAQQRIRRDQRHHSRQRQRRAGSGHGEGRHGTGCFPG